MESNLSNATMQAEKIDSYESLRENFLNLTGHINACRLKQLFQPLVDSERTASIIMSIKDLIGVLEERDCLNEDCVDLLNEILKCCQKLDLLSDSKEIQELQDDIHLHKKEFDLPSNRCQICLATRDTIELIQVPPTAPPSTPDFNYQLQQKFDEIDAVIQYISENIGKEWRKFASILCVKEKKITDIYKKYGEQDTVQPAYEALTEWMKHSHHVSDGEKKEILIRHLQRKNVYHLCPIANSIRNGEHLLWHSRKYISGPVM